MNARRGMTLLEVVVALTIAGLALGAGAAVLGFLADQHSRSGAPAIVSAHAVRSTIRQWTAAARLTTEGDAEFRGAQGSQRLGSSLASAASNSAGSELTFVTGAPTEVSPAGTQVRIYIEPPGNAKMQGLVAELTPWRQSGTPITVSLASAATGFRARYLGSLFTQRVWQPTWISTSVLPAAVELVVHFDTTMATTDRAAQALLALPMIIPLGSRR